MFLLAGVVGRGGADPKGELGGRGQLCGVVVELQRAQDGVVRAAGQVGVDQDRGVRARGGERSGGFAAAGAGYSTNIFPTSLDALFAGITTSVMGALPGFEFTPVNPVSNWFFNIISSIILGFVAVLAILAASMAFAYFGFERIASAVASYRTSVSEADLARTVDRELVAYQGLSRAYTLTGAADDETAAKAAEGNLKSAIAKTLSATTGAARREQVVAHDLELVQCGDHLVEQLRVGRLEDRRSLPCLTDDVA